MRENFRGDLKSTSSWFKGPGGRTCREGGSTLWFRMNGGRQSCDPNSRTVQPADFGHMGCPATAQPGQDCIDKALCKPVALQFSGRWWDDPRGPEIRTPSTCSVDQSGNPYEWTLCCTPGLVSFSICPRPGLHSCRDPRCTDRSCPCEQVPIMSDGTTGCTPRTYRFPRLP